MLHMARSPIWKLHTHGHDMTRNFSQLQYHISK